MKMHFTPPVINSSYCLEGSTAEDEYGIITEITNIFLDSVLTDKVLPDSFQSGAINITDINGLIDKFADDIEGILQENSRILIAVGFGLLLTVLMPILAVVYWISVRCKCCCEKKYAQEYGRCGTAVYGLFLFFLIVFASFGGVWVFTGSRQSQANIGHISQFVDDASHDGLLFIDNTVLEITNLMDTNLDETLESFKNELAAIKNRFPTLVDEILSEANLEDLTSEILSYLKPVNSFNDIIMQMKNLKTSIDFIIGKCANLPSVCEQFETSLNIVSKSLSEVQEDSSISEGNLESINVVKNILTEIDDMVVDLKDSFAEKYFNEVEKQISIIKGDLNVTKNDLTSTIESIKDDIGVIIEKDQMEEYLDYYQYFTLAAIIIGGLLIATLAFLMIGLFLGGATGHGKKRAKIASKLYCGTIGIFLTLGVVYFLVTVATFTVGALSAQLVCKPIKEPEDSDIVEIVLDTVIDTLESVYADITENDVKLNITPATIIQGIKEGQAIYSLFELKNIYDLENLKATWKEEYNINELIQSTRRTLSTTIDDLTSNQAQVDEAFDIANLAAKQIDALLNVVVNDVVTQTSDLNSTLSGILNNPEFGNEAQTVIDQVTHLTTDLTDIFAKYNNDGVFTFTLENDASVLMTSFQTMFNYLQNGGKTEALDFYDESVESLLLVIDQFLIYAVNQTENNLGQVTPIRDIVVGGDRAICRKFFDPFNAVWAGIGWMCLMILGPIAILVKCLRTRYSSERKPSRYQKTRNPHGAPADVGMIDLSGHPSLYKVNSSEIYGQNPGSQYNPSSQYNPGPQYNPGLQHNPGPQHNPGLQFNSQGKYSVPSKYQGKWNTPAQNREVPSYYRGSDQNR